MTPLGAALAPACLALTALGAALQAQVRNFEAEGNLAPNAPLQCTALERVGAASNPVDLYTAARDCLLQDRYEEARAIILLGDVRGRFDTKRVKDKTAHQAVLVAKQSALASVDDERLSALRESFRLLQDPSKRLDFCGVVGALAPPSYFPQYMVSHGMGAFAGQSGSGALVEEFDAPATYRDVVEDYLNCPEARLELSN
ncbi:MAG: hypothetical protein AAF650_06555 [Pseudomonadota bacterium]